MTTEVRTDRFEFSHGCKPRGKGCWIFETRDGAEVYASQGGTTYTAAKRDAAAAAKKAGIATIYAAP